jgi:rhamnogalacturonan endolyase
MKTKHTISKKLMLLSFMFGWLIGSNSLFGQTDVDDINRAVVAVKTTDGIYISWPLLGSDSEDIAFNVYRITDQGSAAKLNDSPITASTNYQDSEANLSATNEYYVVPVLNDVEQSATKTVGTWDQQYLSVPLSVPAGGTTPLGDAYEYDANDISVGDLDGDGEYELVLKWNPTNAKDNSQSGYTGNVFLDGYELDGTRLWRIDLGINIRAGSHYTQFMVYDLDGDGKAEVACKTADGTTDNAGTVIGDGSADYRNSSGYILDGPEFLTVFDGETGDIVYTTDYYPARGTVSDWGDSYGNRVDRFNAAIAYFDGTNPYLMMARGYYTRTVLVAYRFINKQLQQEWIFDTWANNNEYKDAGYEGQGNHQLSIGDVDADGKDEVIFGAMCVDDDGTGLWTTGLGHGDALHVTDMILDRDGLEIWGPHEGDHNPGAALKDARTGEVLWQTSNKDVGRGVAGDLVPEFTGVEVWGGTDGIRSSSKPRVAGAPGSQNFVIWWDGDLSRETLDGRRIYKYHYPEGTEEEILLAEGSASNNSTKSTPGLQADLLGDWREEVIWRKEDNTELRIYTTIIPTEYRLKTLMHDRQYREAIAWQNVGYNQPPHPGVYIGTDMFTAPEDFVPSPPGGMTIVPTATYVELAWDRSLESDIVGYDIYRSVADEMSFQLFTDTVTQTYFKDEDVVIDTEYFYYVLTKDADGNFSASSDTVSAIPTDRPEIVTGLTARGGGDKSLIFWNESPESIVSGYNLYYSETSGSGYTKVNSSLITDTTYLHTGLDPTQTYYYIVRAQGDKESFDTQESAITPGDYLVFQAEDGVRNGGWVNNNHEGYNGIGFVDFDSESSLTFPYIYFEEAGLHLMTLRYALGNSDRTGRLTVNDSTISLTMAGTGAWTGYEEFSFLMKFNAGFENKIILESTGGDFGNLDEITFSDETIDPNRFDCFDVLDGTGYVDDCGVCVGGESSYLECNNAISETVAYRLVLDHSDLCLTSISEDNRATQEACSSSSNQFWMFEARTNGYYIKNMGSNYYLGYYGSSINATETGARDWRIESFGEDTYRIVLADNIDQGIAISANRVDEGLGVALIARSNGAAGAAFRLEEAVLAVDEPNEEIQVYPNPFSDILNVQVVANSDKTPQIEITNILGQVILRDELSHRRSDTSYEFQWDGFSSDGCRVNSGIYFIRVYSGVDMIASRKVVLK